jgi:Flp pilus assembly protein TadB
MATVITPIVYVLTFIAVVILAQVVAGLFFSARDREQRVNRRLTMLGQGMSREEVYTSLVRKGATPGSPSSDVRVTRLFDAITLYCGQAGLSWTPFRVLGIVGAVAAVLWPSRSRAPEAASR